MTLFFFTLALPEPNGSPLQFAGLLIIFAILLGPLIIVPILWHRLTQTFHGEFGKTWPNYFRHSALLFSLLRASVYTMSVGSKRLGYWYFRREYNFRSQVSWWVSGRCRWVVFSVFFYIGLGIFFLCKDFFSTSF